MGKADLHIHSTVSDGMATVPQIMDYVEHETDLDVIAITDHDQIEGAYQALDWIERHPGCRIRVVFGTEVSAFLGRHVLAYFFKPPYPERPFRRFQRFERLIEEVRALGGIIAFPHPTSIWTPSVGYSQIRSLVARGAHVHALEVCNASIGARYSEKKLRIFNCEVFGLAELGGSDAHHLLGIGGGLTHFAGTTVEDLARAIEARATRACWGPRHGIPVRDHARQVVRALIVKPYRELRAALASTPGGAPRNGVPAGDSAHLPPAGRA